MKQLTTLTVGELIERLQKLPKDLRIVKEVESNDGDDTLLASEIRMASVSEVVWSEKHRGFRFPEMTPERGQSIEVVVIE